MNLREASFRLGVIAYGAWLLVVGWQAYVDVVVPNRIADTALATAASEEQARIDGCLAMAGRRDLEAMTNCNAVTAPMPGETARDGSPERPTLWPFLGWGLAPLAAMLTLWAITTWVGYGLRRPQQSQL